MKRWFCLLLWCTSSLAGAESICPEPLRVHLDLHAPSAYLGAQGELQGMDIEQVKLILQQAGCSWRISTTPMTGARILKSLQHGDIDVMIRATVTLDRQQYAWFSIPYRQELVALFSRRQQMLPVPFSYAAAFSQRLTLIGPASGQYDAEFERYRPLFKAQNLYTPYPDAFVGTELLFATPGRGDLLLADADIFYHQLGTARLAQIQLVAGSLTVTPAHLMFSKKTVSAATVAAINHAIQILRRDGRLAAIEQSYRPTQLQAQLATRAGD
jgi:polar amino acid transport system substrate-binding protein